MNANERRMAIIEILCERKKEIIANLMFEFDVSNSTIRRDIQILTVSYPVYTIQGNGGGVYIAKEYKMGKKYLTNNQAELLQRLLSVLTGDDFLIMQSILNTHKMPQKNKEIKIV